MCQVEAHNMSGYLDKLTQVRLLSPEEEQELTLKYFETQDSKIRDKLIKHNMRLVVKAAHKYNLTKNMLNDLVQEGALGLMAGINKYDPHRGVKFGGYVYFWIKAYMLRYIVNNAHPVKIGTTQAQRKLFFNLAKTKAKLAAQGIETDDEMLAEILDVKPEEVDEMQQRMSGPPISLDIHACEGENSPAGNNRGNFADRHQENLLVQEETLPSSLLETKERDQALNALLDDFKKDLPDREAFIFQHRIYGEERKTLQEIGDLYQVTKERIRQVEGILKNKVGRLVRNEIV